jgi:hypothetical protein
VTFLPGADKSLTMKLLTIEELKEAAQNDDSFPWISPSAVSTSPHAAPSSPAAAGEFRKSATVPPARSASATLPKAVNALEGSPVAPEGSP